MALKHVLLPAVAAGALAITGGAAHAQVQSPTPGFFGFVDGMYMFDTSTKNREFAAAGGGGTARAGDGWSIDGKLGYRFDSPLDIALGARYFNQSVGRGAGVFDWHGTDGRYWAVDGEVGYNITGPGFGLRPFVGIRYQDWRAKFSDSVAPIFVSTQKSWGIGPRIGFDASLRVMDSVSLFAGLDTAFLYGKARSSANYAPSGSNTRLIWDVGAKLGVDYEIMPLVHVAVGYKFEYFDGLHFASPSGGGGPKGRAGELVHGPFIRLAYNWGAPPMGMVPPAPPAPPGQVQSFIVFFDFDRATLTSTAVQTIQQAAAQAKSGQVARLTVTGHADRSGSDAYNMALSLRRANAVKDQLVRDGIAASSIAIIGRGESQPLVPTADGVREPQNRRVEIVLG
jgi:opacity protein-like surface antigen